jgi:hypothetical protein
VHNASSSTELVGEFIKVVLFFVKTDGLGFREINAHIINIRCELVSIHSRIQFTLDISCYIFNFISFLQKINIQKQLLTDRAAICGQSSRKEPDAGLQHYQLMEVRHCVSSAYAHSVPNRQVSFPEAQARMRNPDG